MKIQINIELDQYCGRYNDRQMGELLKTCQTQVPKLVDGLITGTVNPVGHPMGLSYFNIKTNIEITE